MDFLEDCYYYKVTSGDKERTLSAFGVVKTFQQVAWLDFFPSSKLSVTDWTNFFRTIKSSGVQKQCNDVTLTQSLVLCFNLEQASISYFFIYFILMWWQILFRWYLLQRQVVVRLLQFTFSYVLILFFIFCYLLLMSGVKITRCYHLLSHVYVLFLFVRHILLLQRKIVMRWDQMRFSLLLLENREKMFPLIFEGNTQKMLNKQISMTKKAPLLSSIQQIFACIII